MVRLPEGMAPPAGSLRVPRAPSSCPKAPPSYPRGPSRVSTSTATPSTWTVRATSSRRTAPSRSEEGAPSHQR
ncbi:hypothetical protein AMK09_31495 [Streptomyces sp. CB02488]|nr:hypothetical protein AMK09_31495 [Streptomyces sp. CB02488]